MRILIGFVASMLLLTACMPAGPQGRISRNSGTYSLLSPEHRELVAAGKIAKGMSKDAVRLAWGSPSRVFEEDKAGVRGERWDYLLTRPVPRPSHLTYGGHSSYSCRHHRDRFCNRCLPHASPDVSYVQHRKGSVWFVGGRVESWEREK